MQRKCKMASKPGTKRGTKKKAAETKTEGIKIEISSKRKNKRKLPEDNSELPPPAAKKRKAGKGKAMNKKERDTLLISLDSIDSSIFKGAICDKVKEQIIPEKLKQFACHLLENKQPLKEIIVYHRHCFAVLYTECKKGPDSFLKFQLR